MALPVCVGFKNDACLRPRKKFVTKMHCTDTFARFHIYVYMKMKAYKGYRPNRVHGKGAGKNGRMCECVETATESETGCDCVYVYWLVK